MCKCVVLCVWGGTCMPPHACGGQKTTLGVSSLHHVGPRIKLGSSGLEARAFTCWASSLVLILDVIFPKARERLRLQTTAWGHGHVGRGFSPGPLFSRKLTWATEKDRGGDPPHHVRVDANLLSVEYLTRHLHSCLSKINPRVLLFED